MVERKHPTPALQATDDVTLNQTRRLMLPESEMMETVRPIKPLAVVPWVIQLRVMGTSHTINLSVSEYTTILGRSSSKAAILPDIDLVTYDGAERGVSRQHAAIVADDEHLMVYDIGSSNGTYLNGRWLAPNQRYPLQNGDVLALGELQLQVIFNVLPASSSAECERIGAGQHLLVIEDDADVAFAYRMMFESQDFTVTTVDDPAHLMATLDGDRPIDAIICDLHMSGQMDGVRDVVHLVRSRVRTVPILVVSGMTGGHHQQQAISSGANDFMGKPVRMDALIERVQELIAAGGKSYVMD